jgi:SAM-dependent MidA family methyltransferase
MTPLGDLLIRRIRATGPITVADYMAECLLHPTLGYYTAREPFGAQGDFITAPEISQMFGELIGLCLAQCWLDQGAPAPFTLAEVGPGRGTLMADLLRATRNVPGFHAAARVTLVEASPRLRALQRKTLGDHSIEWTDSLEELPEAPLFLVANEFFDALPIRQFIRHAQGWQERVIGVQGDQLAFGLTPAVPLAMLDHRLADTAPGALVEHCPALPALTGAIARRIATHGGVALIVDYGDWRSLGDTLQALRGHAPVDPLAAPGEADLTAHVDFEAIARAAAPAAASRLTPQGVFLERLGITARAERLATGLSGPALASHIAAHRRLTHPQEMGTVFKVLAVHPQGHPPPGVD